MDQENKVKNNLDIANQEQRESIKKIEVLKIGDMQKAELVLVVLGVKPATEVSVFKWNDSPDKVKDVLLESGLAVVEKEVTGKEIAEFAVAQDKNTAQNLALLDPAQDHEAFGKLMGFPETAAAGFVGNKRLDKNKYPDLETIAFKFALSESGWKDEVELLNYWNQLLKKYSPLLYNKLLTNK